MKTSIFLESGQAVWTYPNWSSDLNIESIVSVISWRQNQIRIFGKWHNEPRLTAWFGPAYKYSNIQWEATPFSPVMRSLLQRVNLSVNADFNAVLCNLYRDGSDSMGWHADNEPEMNTHRVASLSFGATRTMTFKHRSNGEKFKLDLEDRMLMVMENMQNDWLHAIPKRAKVNEPRLNLTFRQIL